MNHKILIKFFLVIFFLVLPICAQGANSLCGTVTDDQTNDPIDGARILILGTSQETTTNAQGAYSIENLPDGIYSAEVSHTAYKTKTKLKIILKGGVEKNIDFRLVSELIKIPEIVVTAERVKQASISSSATVDIISAEEINRRNVSTLDQALENISGVTLSRSAGTATNSMSIRGSSDTRGGGIGNRVLLLVDGRPAITADTGGANWGMLHMDIVQRVEVVKGALSPLYGSNAMGGVVNFITKSPTNYSKTGFNIGWGYYEKQPEWMRYTDDMTDYADVGLVHSNSYRNLGYLFSISGKKSDGYRQNTDFSLYNTYGKMQYTSQRDLSLSLSLGRASLERGYPHIWLIDNTEPFVHPLKIAYEKTNDRQEKDTWDFDVSLKSPLSPGLKLDANLYHSRNYSRSLYNPNNLENDNYPLNFSTDSDARKSGGILQLDISRLRRNYLVFGFDVQIDEVDSHPTDIMFGNHQSQTLAGFVQDKVTINDGLTAMLGARYDYRHLDDGKNEGQISPKLGLSYQLNDNTAFRFSLGQAFRVPSLAEIYIKQSIHSGLEFIENPDLRSEKLRLYAEIGAKRQLFGLLKTDASMFVYDFSDMIFWEALDESTYQVVNLNSSIIKGAEAGASLSWNWLSVAASYTYLDAEDRTEGRTDDNLPYKPRHSINSSVDCQYSRLSLGLSFRYVSEIEEAIFYPNDAPEAFYVLNAKLSYTLFKQITLSVAINNLLSRQYEEMARYRMPGRSIAFRIFFE